MSWTQAAPYKETMYHRTPSESIANNYTPTANELKMKNLIKIHQSRPHTRATSQPCILYFWSFKRVHNNNHFTKYYSPAEIYRTS